MDIGKFIVFEGIDGCGKGTQIHLLTRYLETKLIPYMVTREPGGTRIGSMIRTILLDPINRDIVPRAEVMLYAMDRAQHVAEKVLPAIRAGINVICDRYVYSTLAYQGGGRGIDVELLLKLHDIATDSLMPDIVFLLDITVEESMRRVLGRDTPDRFEQEKYEFFERVRQAYLKLAKEDERIHLIDAYDSVENIHHKVKRIIDTLL